MTTPDANIEAITIFTGLLYAFGKWAYGKVTGKKQQDLRGIVDEVLTEELEDALEDGDTLEMIESRLSDAVLKLGGAIGLKIPKQTATVAIQAALLKARKVLRARKANQDAAKRIPGQLAENAADAERIAETFKKFPPLGPIDTITEAKAAGVELLEIGPDGKLGPAK